MICSLGCRSISSIVGLVFGFGSIIMLIIYSNSNDLLALGENFISPSLNFYHISPFFGRFIPDDSSRRVAPKLNISAF